jgi:hypothetical protein
MDGTERGQCQPDRQRQTETDTQTDRQTDMENGRREGHGAKTESIIEEGRKASQPRERGGRERRIRQE